LAAHREDASEEALIDESLQLADAGEPEFVLHDAVLDPALAAEAGEAHGLGGLDGGGFFTVDRLAGLDRLLDETRPVQGGAGVEEDAVVRIGKGGVEVGGPALDAVLRGELAEFVLVAAREDGI